MANAIYPKYKQAALSGGANHDLSAGTVRMVLVDLADYTYSATHEFLSDVAGASRVATSAALASKTFTNGTFDAADQSPAFTGVSGDVSEALIFFVDTGVDGTSRLVYFNDTGTTGMPITPDGGNINAVFNASGIFAL